MRGSAAVTMERRSGEAEHDFQQGTRPPFLHLHRVQFANNLKEPGSRFFPESPDEMMPDLL